MQINAGQSVVWDAVPGAIEYEVELLNAAAGQSLGTFVDIGEPSISAALLLSGQNHGNYNVRVRAFDEVGPGAWSALLPLEYAALPAPGNVRVE